MKKTLYLLIVICSFSFYYSFNNNKSFSIRTESLIKMDDNEEGYCPGVSNCCESGYNVMCHMVDPIKNYRVTDVVCGNRGGGVYHKGMDLTKGTGDGNIYAVFDGKIIATTNNTKNCAPGESLICSPVTCPSSRGVSVTLEVTDSRFAGYQVHYMHMSSKTVKVGDIVKQGQLLGKIGNTGCSTGTHLHFQINNYAGKPIYITPYFTDKTSYACGGVTESAPNKPLTNIITVSSLLKDATGRRYQPNIGNCVGSINNKFNQGIELDKKDINDIVNVYALEGGKVVNEPTTNCRNGVTIFTNHGEFHSYCNLENVYTTYQIGSNIEMGTMIGTIGNSKFVYIVKRNNKYVDLTNYFLSSYGGACQNKDRKNCNKILDAIQKLQCKNTTTR